MKIDSKENALSYFVESSINHSKATEQGDYKVINRNYDQIVSAANFLKKEGLLNELKSYLLHDNVGVRIWAATFLLGTFEKEALNILSTIVSENIPHHSFTAEMVIEEWTSGNMKIPFET